MVQITLIFDFLTRGCRFRRSPRQVGLQFHQVFCLRVG